MPTNLDRIQTLLQPEAYAKVRTLAKHNRRALSAMSAELVEAALTLPKYKDQIQEAEVQVPVQEDSREYAPQPQLRREVTAMSKQERKEKGTMSDLVKGLAQAKEDEELDDLIPVESSKTVPAPEMTMQQLTDLQKLIEQMMIAKL